MAQDLNQLSRVLTNLIKQEIKNKGLVDTGKLYKSIEAKVNYTNGKISFDIIAEDYFEFLDNRYGIMDAVLKKTEWNNALEDAFVKIIEKQINI